MDCFSLRLWIAVVTPLLLGEFFLFDNHLVNIYSFQTLIPEENKMSDREKISKLEVILKKINVPFMIVVGILFVFSQYITDHLAVEIVFFATYLFWLGGQLIVTLLHAYRFGTFWSTTLWGLGFGFAILAFLVFLQL